MNTKFQFADVESFDNSIPERILWCTVNLEEQYKCGNLSKAIERDRKLFGSYHFELGCKQVKQRYILILIYVNYEFQ